MYLNANLLRLAAACWRQTHERLQHDEADVHNDLPEPGTPLGSEMIQDAQDAMQGEAARDTFQEQVKFDCEHDEANARSC